MPYFREHINRIIELANQSLVHVQSEDYDTALDDLLKIGKSTNEAIHQVSDLKLTIHQGKDPAKRLEG